MKGIIDRIEDGGWAVVLVGANEDQQLDVPIAELPEDATDGTRLILKFEVDNELAR